MNKEIQSQVLKENFLDGSIKFKPLLIPEQYNEHVKQLRKTISRTIELVEKEMKIKNMQFINWNYDKGLKDAKANFRKMIDEKIIHINKSYNKKEQNDCSIDLSTYKYHLQELLAKLGDDDSPDLNIRDTPEVQPVKVSSGTSKGCGKEYCASCKVIGKECDESIPCGTKMPLIIGEGESYWLCSSCKKKTSTCKNCGKEREKHFIGLLGNARTGKREHCYQDALIGGKFHEIKK